MRAKSKGYEFRPSSAIPILGFLPSLRVRGTDEIMSSGALHQIMTGRVCNNNVDQSVPHRNIRNYNIYTPSAIPRSRRRKEASALPMCVLARPTNDVVNCIAPASAAQRVGPQRVQRVST